MVSVLASSAVDRGFEP